MDYGALSLISPLITIVLALVTKEVTLALFFGILSGLMIMTGGNIGASLSGTLDSLLNVFKDAGNVKIFIFNMFMGAFVVLIQASGGMEGAIEYLTIKTRTIKTRRMAQALAYVIGMLIFIDGYLSILLSGIVTRPIIDRFKVSREMLSYISDSVSAPINALIPLNSWGAMLMGLIGAQITAGVISGNPSTLLIQSLPFEFYCILAVVSVGFFILTGKHFGPMKVAENRVLTTGEIYREGANPIVSKDASGTPMKEGITPSMWNMLIPLITLISTIVAVLLSTGQGNILRGDGTSAILWGVILALIVAAVLYTNLRNIFTMKDFMTYTYKGMSGMLPLIILLVFAFANGKIVSALGAGKFLAHLVSQGLPGFLCAAMVFVLGALMSFSTGTSWGTFAIMMPIAIPMAVSLDANVVLTIGAVISGGVFGNHCSPVADTVILASMAAATDHYDHVSTQMPYAITCAILATGMYVIAGLVMQ